MKGVFYKALARLVEGETGRQNVTITNVEQGTQERGYCDTCAYSEAVPTSASAHPSIKGLLDESAVSV